ncbi:alpha/beta hydrolase [Alphaproteobacteria bacterium]|nr:alpha/beta hydrolase [Alphaproteobacteria bacterium]
MLKTDYKYNYKKFNNSSPLMIFIHGAGCDNTFWSLLNRYYFFKGYSVLAINLPGHGDNKDKGLKSIEDMANYVKKIVKKYSSKKNILVGHSMGSLICLSIIQNKLFDAQKVVLIGVALPMLVSKNLLNMSKKNSNDAIATMINWSLPNDSKLKGNHLIGINLPNLFHTLMNKSANNLFFDLNACNKFFIDEHELKKIKNSFLIIAGKLDKMTHMSKSNILKNSLTNSFLEVIENCGHFHIHERAAKVRNLINKYIEN